MGHNIEALIIPEAVAPLIAEELEDTRAIALRHGLCLVPVTEATFDALRARFPELADQDVPGFCKLSGPVTLVARELSEHGPVAYVETEYFGGSGAQSATVWDQGLVVMPPTHAHMGPINTALRMLGVKANPPYDEFDAVGLGDYRSNERWLGPKKSYDR